MIKELPGFVHRCNYSHFYIFLDNEVIQNRRFNASLKQFSTFIDGDVIMFELIVPENSQKYVPENIIPIPNKLSIPLDYFYDLHINENNNLLYYYFFNFFITDKTKSWEIYCSSTIGIAVAACNEDVNSKFLEFLNPYKELTLEMKLEEIDFPGSDHEKSRFIETLRFNYSL